MTDGTLAALRPHCLLPHWGGPGDGVGCYSVGVGVGTVGGGGREMCGGREREKPRDESPEKKEWSWSEAALRGRV